DENGFRVLQEAYQLSRGLQDPSARAQASCALGLSLNMQGQNGRAESLIQEGLHELPNDPQFALDRVFCLLNSLGISGKSDSQQVLAQAQSAQRVLNDAPFASSYLRMTVSIAL